MSIGKSVSNLISHLHEFFQNFSQSPSICFELISFGVIFNSEIADKRVSRRAPRRARVAAHRCRVSAMRHTDSVALSAVGTARRASRPRPALRARPLRRPSLAAPAHSPTASLHVPPPQQPPSRPPLSEPRRSDRSRPRRPSLIAVAPPSPRR
jgi:hypothetical protein